MRSVLTISAGLLFGLALSSVAHANDHKVLGVIAMPRNETNDLTLKIPVCRIVKRIQLTADHGDIELSGASVYFKTARSAIKPERPFLNQRGPDDRLDQY